MRRVAAALAASCVALWNAGARAEPDAVHAGAQAAPPLRAVEPRLDQELDGRRNIRGCAVDEACGRAQDILREFEIEKLPPPGRDPWLDERVVVPASRLEANHPRIAKKPSELRPDAPWLDTLELPDLPVKWTQRLADYLVFYRDDPRGRSIMAGWLVAQGRYRELIVSHLRKAKLPEDLLYVAMIESSYDPQTLSRAGALGLWQWMPEAAKIYGLRRDRWVDERKDPYRSTIAQMDYFRDLYQRFGDWHIALASFNVGYGAMLRSIARYNTNDYYQLCEYENAVPWETCWYTPKVIATAIVGRNRAAFGFDKLKVAAPEAWEDVAVPTSMSLALIARAAGVGEADIKRLNPHLRRNRTPPGEPGYRVRVPAGKRAESARRLAELQSDWDGYDAYVVAHGERLEDVATSYGLSTFALKKLNNIAHESEIEGGTVLVVPRISADQRAKNRAKAKAKLHSSGVDQKEGDALIVPVLDKDAVIAGKHRVFYRVVAGDTLPTVSKAFGLPTAELAKWNGLEPAANLHPRMVLVAWVPDDFDPERRKVALLDDSQLVVVTRGSPEHLDLAEARVGRVRTEYVATAKEKLADVAKKFGMGSHDLARINRISYNTVLAKGDKIIVYQVTDPTRSDRAEEQWKKTPKSRRGKLTGTRAERAASVDGPDADDAKDPDDDGRNVTATRKEQARAAPKQTATKSDDKPAAKPATPKPKPDAKSDTKPNAKPDAKPDAKSDAKGDTKPVAKVDAKPRGDAPSAGSTGPVTKPTQLD
ncbi:MAG: LysM peptidoglycan-binding domain-containing protein [Deltaproteobacteria bacterium]|nr:LysM peptidoglycan-binding domain-containing protein [Deltaproteobacteria bacterium]